MAKHILKCISCGCYTMHENVCNCGGNTVTTKPPKYSPEDKYGKYRRDTKHDGLVAKGLI